MSDALNVHYQDRLRAAAFFHEALAGDVDPETLEPELKVLKAEAHARVFSVELESSVGHAAFLIYQYEMDAGTVDGRAGRVLFKNDLEVMELAAERETPGPRILAHATTDAEGYILATTPATFRALTGAGASENLIASEADLLPGADTTDTRKTSADELLRLLRLSNDQAKRWFAAARAGGRAGDGSDLPFSQEEMALSLFLIDEESIQDLLRLLAVMVANAQRQAKTSFNQN